ncbi:MAG: septum formation inhibitor Maf [Idiomarina sp.]|nr:septum formation inhibitor Maf [Idiomarina sp.]
MSAQRQLVLASSSPYRKALLERLGLHFSTCSPAIDESPLPDEDPQALVLRLAQQKAQAVAPRFPQGIMIASDQVAVLDTHILGKPGDTVNAHAQLSACSGRDVTFFTSLCVYDAQTQASECLVEPFTVGFRNLSDAEIHTYIKKEQPFDCAGSFKSEGLGISLFSYMRGDDPNSLIGLPLIQLLKILRESYAMNPLHQA